MMSEGVHEQSNCAAALVTIEREEDSVSMLKFLNIHVAISIGNTITIEICSKMKPKRKNKKPYDQHTDKYNYYHPVLRRGASFQIKCNSHRLRLYFNKNPTITLTIHGHNFNVPNDGGWDFDIKSNNTENNYISITIYVPYDAIIGKYLGRVSFQNNDDDTGAFSFILFYNPWNPKDITYMRDTSKLNEYILNEHTKIFMGSASYFYGSDWYLGQFQTPCIEATLMLLKRIPLNEISNPVSVARYMSALVNSNDDNGIVMGNWRGHYGDGTNPSAWRSSVEIMRKYSTNGCPVKYGQCWVFGAILCTVCRCIGIPNRMITAFDAFHDGDKSLEWEIYYDEHLNLLNRGYDSCWNFHVWTEAWLNRYDLGSKYSGWQILDATPQERSAGIFRVGPAPRYAVKEGYVTVNYDVGFVFAEVNADKVHYVRQKNGKFIPFKVEKGKVSTKILTKSVGSSAANDITSDYKYPDGSSMDKVIDSRIINVRGRTHFMNSTLANDNTNSHINIDDNAALIIKIRSKKKIDIGDSYNACVIVRSSSRKPISGQVSTTFLLVTYNGKISATLLEDKQNITGKKFEKPFCIDGKLISNKMKNEISILKVVVTVMTNSGHFSTKTRSICLMKPSLSISFSNKVVKCFKLTRITVTIHNTLKKKIQSPKIYVESPCLHKRVGERICDINTNSTVECYIDIKPTKTGRFALWVYLDSQSISGFHSYSYITVK